MGLAVKILITGINGYIGSNLAIRCDELGYNVIPFHRGDHFWKIRETKPDVIFHLAGEIYKEIEMFDSNVELTNYLLQTARVSNVQAFVYVGSSSEYGRKNHPIAETDCLSPTTWYEATKGCGSLLVLGSTMPAIVARPFSVYGKNEPYRRFIPLIYQCYTKGNLLEVGPGVHDFIYIDDFVEGLLFCMNRLLSGIVNKDVINFGTGKQTSNVELVECFERVVGQSLNWQPAERRKEYDSTCWCCDTTYAESIGYRAQASLVEGLEHYIRYRQANPTSNLRY